MAKALVIIGHHYGELDWGREVKAAYEARGLQGDRDITFYEVANSTVETGDLCPTAIAEIERILDDNEFDVWIDVHCGFKEPSSERTVLGYKGTDEELLSRARELPDVLVSDYRKIPEPYRQDALESIFNGSAVADPYFSERDFSEKTERYQQALDETLEFINDIYDIHVS